MKPREYRKIQARLQAGETVEITDVVGFLREQTADEIRRGMEAAGRCSRPLNVEDLNRILTVYGGNRTIWALFTRIVARYGVTSEALAEGLAQAYTMGAADRQTALLLFRNTDPRQLMNAEDLDTLRGFPEVLTIYRGGNLNEQARRCYGLSWTRDRQTAEFFAWRFDPQDTTRAVYSTTVRRADVLAYFNTRREQEIITDVRGPVEVIAREPSPLYWERMRREPPTV